MNTGAEASKIVDLSNHRGQVNARQRVTIDDEKWMVVECAADAG